MWGSSLPVCQVAWPRIFPISFLGRWYQLYSNPLSIDRDENMGGFIVSWGYPCFSWMYVYLCLFHGTQPSIFMDEKWRGTPMTQETSIGTQFWISIVRWNHGQLWIESSVSQQFALQWVSKVFKSSNLLQYQCVFDLFTVYSLISNVFAEDCVVSVVGMTRYSYERRFDHFSLVSSNFREKHTRQSLIRHQASKACMCVHRLLTYPKLGCPSLSHANDSFPSVSITF